MSSWRVGPFVSLVLLLSACDTQEGARSPRTDVPTVPGHSVDLAAIDKTVKPGADFYDFANGAWYKTAQIPADRGATGVDLKVEEEVEAHVKAVLSEAAAGKNPPGSPAQKIGDFYASVLDEAGIDAKGLAPLQPTLERIAKLADTKTLSAYLGSTVRADVDALNATNFHTDNVLGLWVEQDLNDATKAAPYFMQGGLGLPDRAYYVDEAPRMAEIRKKYQKHLATLFQLAGMSEPDARAARAYGLEVKLAKAHGTRVDSEDVSKANNPWKREEFATKAPGMDWDAFLGAAGLDKQPGFLLWHPTAVVGLGALVKSEPLDAWKDYLVVRAIEHATAFLPKAFTAEGFAFYGKELAGAEAPPPRERLAGQLTNESLGEAVGKVYVERYFPAATKKAVAEMVQNLVTAFGARIDRLAWMSPQTKAKAKEKLGTLKVGVGYPDAWRDDSGLAVVRGDALGNFQRAELFEYRRNLAKLGRAIDRGEWVMVPQIVNAVNLPVRNALNFPAGILSPPYFDPKATPAANYGAIGSVIGHEISHSFDDQGAKFDAQGSFKNWWTPDDLKHFEASGAALAAQFNAYKPFADAHVDGGLTLSENIADLAGLAIAFDAWRASLGGKPAPMQDGLTGEQQFFLSFAQSWQMKQREAVLRARLATNSHAPAHYRTLTVRNLDEWYEAFDVKAGEPLFLAPPQRVRVW